MLADPLTKKKAVATDLLYIIQTGRSLEAGSKPPPEGEEREQQ